MEKNAKNAVGYFSPSRSGCSWYRIEHPMNALRKAGIPVHKIGIDEEIDESVIDSLMSFQLYGAVPFSFEPVLKYLKGKGIKIIFDMDDALDLIEPSNPHYFSVKKDVGSVRQVLDYADEVTVATPMLEKHVKEHYNYQGKVTVLPNCYDPEEWKVIRPPHDDIRVGFAGSSSHVSDLIEVLPAIKSLQEKYDIKFYIMGFGQESYGEWSKKFRYTAHNIAREELNTLDTLLKEITYVWIPFVDHSIYPQTLTNMALDIGICPLKDTPFNNCRSASKAMEYTLSGALAVANDVEAYRNDMSSITIWDWSIDLNRIVEGFRETHDVYQKDINLKWLQENRDINTKIDLIKSVYVVQ